MPQEDPTAAAGSGLGGRGEMRPGPGNSGVGFRWRKWRPRDIRMLVYLAILLAVAGWRFIPRPWHPSITLQTAHHTLLSTATRQQTDETAQTLTLLFAAYSNRLGTVPQFDANPPKLKVKLYKDRDELRRVNPGLGWAEAFYRKPYCHAYFSAREINPYHWMLHESVHQLNREVAHLSLAKWLEEGVAEYFSTSCLATNELLLGTIDPNTYPVWWIDEIATSADLAENLRNGSVIPLRQIVTHRGGPSMNSHFNLYYLHWWSLTHFVFEGPQYRHQAQQLLQSGGGLPAFEQILGPIDQVQTEWHAYVRELKNKVRESPRPGTPVRGGVTQGLRAPEVTGSAWL